MQRERGAKRRESLKGRLGQKAETRWRVTRPAPGSVAGRQGFVGRGRWAEPGRGSEEQGRREWGWDARDTPGKFVCAGEEH